jgi:hypothetical protein
MRSKNAYKYTILLVVWIISAVCVGRFCLHSPFNLEHRLVLS